MIQELVFTTLPNQKITRDGKQYLQLSVFVTPRVKSITQLTLDKVPDMLHWAAKIKETKFVFRIAGMRGDMQATLDKDQIDVDFYESVFHKNIIVEKSEMEQLQLKQINSFPVKHITDFLYDNYQKAAIESPKKLLPADYFIDPVKLGVISDLQIDPKTPAESINTGRKAPLQVKSIVLQNDTLHRELKTTLREQKFVPYAKMQDPSRDFTQLRNFHKLEKPDLPPLILKKPNFEFHNIISVVNSFPQMMRKLGFILDFTIPYSTGIPANGTIHLVPQSLSFTETATSVSVPLSAYTLVGDSFVIDDSSDSLFKKGFVKINTDDFSVVQIDTDGLALKTANAVESKTMEIARYFESKSKLTLNPAVRPENIRMQQTRRIQQVQPFQQAQRVQNATLNIQPKNTLQLQRIKPFEKLKIIEPPAKSGLPTMRSAGIALIRNGISKQIVFRLERNIDFQKKLIDDAPLNSALKLKIPFEILYSNDVVMGYRMDIAYEENPTKWFSLHQRKNTYSWFDDLGAEHPVTRTGPDEGYIELALTEQRENKENLFVSETLARWEGWSLSVGRPGLTIDESNDHPAPELKDKHDFLRSRVDDRKRYLFDPTLDFKLNVQSNIVPGTLPKLRYGKNYRIRIRTVDLAGNSLPLTAISESPGETFRSNIKYLRYEPLSGPIALVGNALRDGEFLEQMVIRSNFDQSSVDYEKAHQVRNQASDGKSIRYLLPPKGSQLGAETHGMFEKAFGNNPDAAKKIYDIITSHEGLYEPEKVKINRETVQREKVYKPSDIEIIYLPDPLAAGIAIFADEECENTHTQDFSPRMFSFFNREELSPTTTNNVTIPEDWYNAGVIRFVLEEGPLNSSWDRNDRIFKITLPKGNRIKLKISTFWREKDLKELSALWQLIKEGASSKLSDLESTALSGQHWMLSPPRNMELVHAVQQPVEAPVLQKVLPERDYGDTSADLNARFTIHGESTDFVELQAAWTEQVDDGISVEIETKNFRYTIPDIDIYYHDKIVTLGNIPEFRPDLNIAQKREVIPVWKNDPVRLVDLDVQPGAVKINNLYRKQATQLVSIQKEKASAPLTLTNSVKFELAEFDNHFVKLLDLRNYPLDQSFGDTKHRWIDYSIVATTRYTEYFAHVFKANDKYSFKRESEPQKAVNILSTARPAKPEIDYIIPTFEWQRVFKQDTFYHRRKGGGLRIYLKRPWYSSGDDERLAVILKNPETGGGVKTMTYIMPTYTNVYTHWGVDPLFISAVPQLTSPSADSFRLNPIIDKDLIYPQVPEQNANKVMAVAYPVEFDKERQLWFCDIAIDTDQMYFPFIKLALARYQQHSLRTENTDCCLSSVVMAGMMQMVPERTATMKVSNESDSVRLTITVSGPVYSERQSKFDVISSLKFSIVDSMYPQPIQGVLTDGKNRREMEVDHWETNILATDNAFSITHEIRIPKDYKTNPFQVVIEEIEHGPKTMDVPMDKYGDRLGNPEETDKLVYADVFKVNEK